MVNQCSNVMTMKDILGSLRPQFVPTSQPLLGSIITLQYRLEGKSFILNISQTVRHLEGCVDLHDHAVTWKRLAAVFGSG